MKIINYWTGAALAIIATITTSLVLSTGEAEPAMSAAILLLSTLALGWGAGAHASRHQVDRLTRLERARRVQALCHAADRDRMEAEIERLQRQIADSTPSAYDWCPECHTRQSTPQAEDLTPDQVDTLIASYTGLDRAATPDAFSDAERLVYAVIAGGGDVDPPLVDGMGAAPAAAQTEPNAPETRMDTGGQALLEQARPQSEDGPGPALDQGDTGIPVPAPRSPEIGLRKSQQAAPVPDQSHPSATDGPGGAPADEPDEVSAALLRGIFAIAGFIGPICTQRVVAAMSPAAPAPNQQEQGAK